MSAQLKSLLFDNLGLKICSILIAVILWYTVKEENEIDAFIDVAVEIKNRPAHLIIANAVVEKINLLVHGSQAQIAELRQQPPYNYMIDLTNAVAGNSLYKVYPDDFKLPEGVKIRRVTPEQLTLVLENQNPPTVSIPSPPTP